MAKPGKVFIFFNCDAEKSEASMNIFYNRAVYKDTKTSRKNADNLKTVELAITEGDPVEASNFIQFGAIREIECY